MHRFLLHNGQIHETTEKIVTPGQVGLLNGWGVFSTLRVKDGVLFAWERHFARMKKDAALMHVSFPESADGMQSDLLRLVEANEAYNATLRVAVIRNTGGMFEAPDQENSYDIVAFTKDLANWGTGVRLAVQEHGRLSKSPYAGAKILSWSHNLTMLETAQKRGFDEMLLLDEEGFVSECTSANLFVVEGEEVWTPPLRNGCLPGVTRAIILEEIHVPGVTLGVREIRPDDLSKASGLFITSSTRDLLPVTEVEGISIRQEDRVRPRLQEAFQEYLRSYVAQAPIRAGQVQNRR